MTIDLLPFSAFALESSGPAPSTKDSHTLTLRPVRTPVDASYESAMNGSAKIEALAMDTESLWRATVVPATEPGLTITF